jgi:hypothetical protein
VSIILLESTDTSETGQGTGELVSVEDTKVSEPPRQVLVVDIGMGEDPAVSRAVHRLEAELLLLDLEGEHVLGIVAPVAGCLPEIRLVHVGGHDLLETALAVLLLHQGVQGVVDAGAVGEPEGGARGDLVEEEELLVRSDLSVVALRRLGQEGLVLFEGLLVGERDTGDSLDGLVLAVTKPVRSRVLHNVRKVCRMMVRDICRRHTLSTENALMLPV